MRKDLQSGYKSLGSTRSWVRLSVGANILGFNGNGKRRFPSTASHYVRSLIEMGVHALEVSELYCVTSKKWS